MNLFLAIIYYALAIFLIKNSFQMLKSKEDLFLSNILRSLFLINMATLTFLMANQYLVSKFKLNIPHAIIIFSIDGGGPLPVNGGPQVHLIASVLCIALRIYYYKKNKKVQI